LSIFNRRVLEIYPVRKPTIFYGGDSINKASAPYRKGGVKTPVLSNGVYFGLGMKYNKDQSVRG
jgi:hypothetical protein